MANQIIEKLIYTFQNFDKKLFKILKYGLKFCFVILLISIIVLITYLFFIHTSLIYKIGLAIFELSLCFAAEFIASAITIDTIIKQNG